MAKDNQVTIGPAWLPDGKGPIELTVRDGRIARIVLANTVGDADRRRHVAPGLIDIQVNGYAGIGFTRSDLTIEQVRNVVDLLAAEGVTRFVPTLVTNAHQVYLDALRVLADACDRDPRVAEAVVCFHLEGPWISPDDGPRGAHPLEHVRTPLWDEFAAWQDVAGGRIGYVTLAPEVPGAVQMIERLASLGIVVALGHTAASGDQVQAAVDAGARLSTHLGNGSHKMLDRHENYIWQQAAKDRLWASFIADGHHLPGSTLKALIRAKTPRRSILVSDAATVAGLPPGPYESFGAKVEIRPDGRLCLAGTPYLAGSAQSLWHGISTATHLARVSLDQAFTMAGAHPAELFGLREETGAIRKGLAADLVEFNWDPELPEPPELVRTYVSGEVVYARE